jgi:outer membrane protein OmpA-like peptidoglycan-associated protein
VDTVVRFRRDTLLQARVDTVRLVRVDTVSLQDVDDQLVLRVQFMTDSTVLLRRSLPVLDTIALAMAETPGGKWAVEGHTDNVGDHAHNQILSLGRAQAVVDYLVSKGVARSSLEARGFGETRPVFSNATLAGKAQNRRVQLRRIPPPPRGPVVR